MAFPTILVNSATGSDSAASGAGPSTALTGAAGVSTGTTVVLDGSPNLAGVATDGSHVLFFNDTTSGNRNFAKITGTANSGTPTAQVTLADAVAVTTKAWAIGGKRASIASTSSLKLFDEAGSDGDAKAGWIVEMESGHTESVGAQINIRVLGDITSGPFIVRGTAGAGTKPIVTLTAETTLMSPRYDYIKIMNFEMQCTSGSRTSAYGIHPGSSGATSCTVQGMVISHASNYFARAVTPNNGFLIASNNFGYCTEACIIGTDTQGVDIIYNYLHDGAGYGIYLDDFGSGLSLLIEGNLVTTMANVGIFVSFAGDSSNRHSRIIQNTVDSCGSHGIQIGTSSQASRGSVVTNNAVTNNSGYGINFSNCTVPESDTSGLKDSNDLYNNSSGAYNPSGIGVNTVTANPTYTGGGNFTPTNTAVRGVAIPLSLNTAVNYQWLGAIQALVAIALKRFFLIPS